MEYEIALGTIVDIEEDCIEVLIDNIDLIEQYHRVECHRFTRMKILDRVLIKTEYGEYQVPKTTIQKIEEE
jgi:hypothetical protein